MSSGDVVGASVDGMNSTDAGNENVKIPATAEGMAIAYASLIIMALFPIFLGSVRSVKHHKEQKQQHKVRFMVSLLVQFAIWYSLSGDRLHASTAVTLLPGWQLPLDLII